MRIEEAILMAAAMTCMAVVAVADPLSQAVLACRDLADDHERVRCYDAAVDQHESGDGTADEVRTGTQSPEPDPASSISAEELFGKSPLDAQRSLQEAAGAEPIDRIEATVTEIRTIAPKRIAVWLDNGQVWKQTDTSTLRVKEGDEIVIRRRSLGSHTLQKKGRATSMRVARVY